MAKKKDTNGCAVARKSGWSGISIFWHLILCCIVIPVVFGLIAYGAWTYDNSLNDYLWYSGNEVTNAAGKAFSDCVAYRNAFTAGETVLVNGQLWQGGMYTSAIWEMPVALLLGLPVFSFVPFHTVRLVFMFGCIVIAAVALFEGWRWLIVKIIRTRKTVYEFRGNALVMKQGRVFGDVEEVRRLVLVPGMNVTVEQKTTKSWFFRYGDVTISSGLGEAGQIIMQDVKNPYKVAKKINEMIQSNCLISPYPYAMPPYSMMYGVGGGFNPSMMTSYPMTGGMNPKL